MGYLEAGGIGKDVAFAGAGQDLDDDIAAAYRSKYRRYLAGAVDSVLSPRARATAIKLVPR